MVPKIIVELKNAEIAQDKRKILTNVNLKVAQAEFCYLIGKTGSGKSSLLKTLYGAIPLRKGEAFVAGMNISKLNHHNKPLLRRKLGMIFQDFKLFTKWTVKANLQYVLEATDWKDETKMNLRIEETLGLTNLLHKKNSLVDSLSGGEQQRLSIARAILNYPELLVADEPTGNLDPDSADDILYLLRDLTIKHKMATIFATHDYRLIKKFPARVFECADQTIHEK